MTDAYTLEEILSAATLILDRHVEHPCLTSKDIAHLICMQVVKDHK